MTAEEAENILGLSSAKVQGFEEILSAKNKLIAANQNNRDKIMQVSCMGITCCCYACHHAMPHSSSVVSPQIEAAYDVLFMRSMKRRISGEVEVATSVRFADVPTTKKRSSGQASST